MNEEYYMQQVELILDMHEVADERVDKISKLSLPDDASPLAILIHGDSRQLLEATKYAQQDDPYTPSVEEVQKLRKNLTKVIFSGRYQLAQRRFRITSKSTGECSTSDLNGPDIL